MPAIFAVTFTDRSVEDQVVFGAELIVSPNDDPLSDLFPRLLE